MAVADDTIRAQGARGATRAPVDEHEEADGQEEQEGDVGHERGRAAQAERQQQAQRQDAADEGRVQQQHSGALHAAA
jgi:hypothetical protein